MPNVKSICIAFVLFYIHGYLNNCKYFPFYIKDYKEPGSMCVYSVMHHCVNGCLRNKQKEIVCVEINVIFRLD